MPTLDQAAAALQAEFSPVIAPLGYGIAAANDGHTRGDHMTGLSPSEAAVPCICVRILPTTGPNPPSGPLLTRMRMRLLPRYYLGYAVCSFLG